MGPYVASIHGRMQTSGFVSHLQRIFFLLEKLRSFCLFVPSAAQSAALARQGKKIARRALRTTISLSRRKGPALTPNHLWDNSHRRGSMPETNSSGRVTLSRAQCPWRKQKEKRKRSPCMQCWGRWGRRTTPRVRERATLRYLQTQHQHLDRPDMDRLIGESDEESSAWGQPSFQNSSLKKMLQKKTTPRIDRTLAPKTQARAVPGQARNATGCVIGRRPVCPVPLGPDPSPRTKI
jgi:hypothetical protein